MKRFGPMLMALLAAVLLAVFATTPPEATPSDAPLRSFSATRAMADVRTMAKHPHVTGSAENAVVRTPHGSSRDGSFDQHGPHRRQGNKTAQSLERTQ